MKTDRFCVSDVADFQHITMIFQNMYELVTFSAMASFLFCSGKIHCPFQFYSDRSITPGALPSQDEKTNSFLSGLVSLMNSLNSLRSCCAALVLTKGFSRFSLFVPLLIAPCAVPETDGWNNRRGGEVMFGEGRAAIEGSQTMTQRFLTLLVASPPVCWGCCHCLIRHLWRSSSV